MREEHEDSAREDGNVAVGETPAGEQDFPGLGAQVAGVFTAAERAAQQMVAMARDEVEDIHRRARAEAEALRQRRISQAEEEARRLVAEAQAEAHGIGERAQKAAWEIEEAARKRAQRVVEDARVLEERVEWAREGLREVMIRLDHVAAEHPPDVDEPGEPGEREEGEQRERERPSGIRRPSDERA